MQGTATMMASLTSPVKGDKGIDALFETYVREIRERSALLRSKEQRMRIKVRSCWCMRDAR